MRMINDNGGELFGSGDDCSCEKCGNWCWRLMKIMIDDDDSTEDEEDTDNDYDYDDDTIFAVYNSKTSRYISITTISKISKDEEEAIV